MVIVVFGPAGSGKTTIGRALAERLGWRFLEGDQYHSPENIAAMRSRQPLTDEQRKPWLAALAREIAVHIADGRDAVLACSALKRAHRAALIPSCADRGDVQLVYLHASRAVLEARVRARPDHFFPAELVETQLVNFEDPAGDEAAPVMTVDAEQPVACVVDAVCAELGFKPKARAAQGRRL
jgi:carbohydrate kinase (thermoresistant glucokinase family)